MSAELFPDADMAKDSPRLAWCKKHGVRLHNAPSMDEPWAAWFSTNVCSKNPDGVPLDTDLCGFGQTDDDALRDLAVRNDVPLWNEEGHR